MTVVKQALKISKKYGDEIRTLTVDHQIGVDGNIVIRTHHGVPLTDDEARELAYSLLQRIGEPHPSPKPKPFQKGEFVQNWQGQPTNPQVYRLVEPYVMHGDQQWWKVEYLSEGEVKTGQIQTNRAGADYRHVDILVQQRTVWLKADEASAPW